MWVIVFCILLGYFASFKHSSSLAELINNIFKRYIRFVEPLIMLAVVILGLDFTVGFEIRTDIIANKWLGLPMNVTVQDILKMMFTFDHALDGPLWSLRVMFVSGIVLYILDYILNKLKANVNHKMIVYSLAMVITFFVGRRNDEVERVIGARAISNDTNHSFYVYILHMIVMKTVGVCAFSVMLGKIGFGYASIATTACCLLLTSVISIAFGSGYNCFHRNIKKERGY